MPDFYSRGHCFVFMFSLGEAHNLPSVTTFFNLETFLIAEYNSDIRIHASGVFGVLLKFINIHYTNVIMQLPTTIHAFQSH